MRAMVFAAGLGTRLRPLTEELPKPVVPVANRPLCVYAVEHLARFGAERAVLNTHHLADRVRVEVEAVTEVPLTFLHEPSLLGTGGALHHARTALDDGAPFVVMNGDILFEPDLAGALALHAATGAIATMVVRPDPDAFRYGAIELDAEGRVRKLLGKPDAHDTGLRATMFTGVHVMSARALVDMPSEGCVIRTAYRSWMERGEVVAAFVDPQPWRDLGTPREYLEGNLARLDAGRSLVADDAELAADARIDRSVIGRYARIEPGAELSECVVWRGAVVRGRHHRAVITPRSCVQLG